MCITGVLIGRPTVVDAINGLDYLIADSGELRHFPSFDDARGFLTEHNIPTDDITLQFHTYCLNCGKEYFLSEDELFQDELGLFHYCKACDSSFDV